MVKQWIATVSVIFVAQSAGFFLISTHYFCYAFKPTEKIWNRLAQIYQYIVSTWNRLLPVYENRNRTIAFVMYDRMR